MYTEDEAREWSAINVAKSCLKLWTLVALPIVGMFVGGFCLLIGASLAAFIQSTVGLGLIVLGVMAVASVSIWKDENSPTDETGSPYMGGE